MPAVSVLMSAYNESPDFLTEAIESVLRQTFADFEFIILLDNPDNDAARQLISRYARTDKRIRFVINERNLGLARSLNKGIDLAMGEYVCRMDADDVSEPNRIEVQLNQLETARLDLVGSCMTVIDENGVALDSANSIPQSAKSVAKALRYNNCVPHPTWLGRKAVFDLHYRLVPLCEDYDLLMRAALSGFSLGNVKSELVRYRMSQKSVSRSHLYDQFLFQRELTKAYSRGEYADIQAVEARVIEHSSPKAAQRYASANRAFNDGLTYLRTRRPLDAMISFLRVPLLSPSYSNKVYRLLRTALIRG